ncbi:hypothetical protein [Caldimonas brevitalea]|uniref:Uncharacterized protein n=1 Tax=Caldimonas brevitalea TaxID=413882 RepID=A0A0G3BJ25_9BURK|nr:hypothetical protein [Caldimonas brevitalea]AKJ29449.1 hypothetical protein AAW51_2758 [Caldimonas brevitalea]
MLSQKDATDPEAVVAWLKANAAKADKAAAKMAYEHGQALKKRKDWGAATKAFGDSTAFYPTPAAFTEVAEAQLRMLGEIRQRHRNYDQHWRRDIGEAEATYRSALAADSVLRQMTAQERQQAQQNAECLADYLKSAQPPRNCAPLKLYGLPGT